MQLTQLGRQLLRREVDSLVQVSAVHFGVHGFTRYNKMRLYEVLLTAAMSIMIEHHVCVGNLGIQVIQGGEALLGVLPDGVGECKVAADTSSFIVGGGVSRKRLDYAARARVERAARYSLGD